MPDSSDHVLDAAERLFLERGYSGTRLRDLADAIGIKQASLYHHAPGGKRELWERVIDRTFDRHRENLTAAAETAPDLRGQLMAMAAWILSQPSMNVIAMSASSLPSSPQPNASEMATRIYQGVMKPIDDVVQAAVRRGEARATPPGLVAGMVVASLNAVVHLVESGVADRPALDVSADVIDVVLKGVYTPGS